MRASLSLRHSTRHNLYLGKSAEGKFFLSENDLKEHVAMFGATGTGKTNGMSVMLVQHIANAAGVYVNCPMGELADRAVEFCHQAKRKDVIYFEPGDPRWVTPLDIRDFEAELAVGVGNAIQMLLAAWDMTDTNQTPQMDMWLRTFFTVSIQANIDTPFIDNLLDYKTDLRKKFAPYVTDPAIRRRLLALDGYKHHDFVQEVGSTLRKLFRFAVDSSISRCMGLGANAINFRKIMDEGQVLIASLQQGKHLDAQMQRMFGVLLVNGFYYASLARPSKSRPFYAYIDEAPMFATQALGDGLDRCRQKGLRFIFAVQRPSQFKTDNPKLYDSIKNGAQTRIVFRATTRADAIEMIDDMVFGLADPKVKYELWGIAYRPVNTYLPSYSSTEGGNEGWDDGASEAIASARMRGGNLLYGSAAADNESASETKKDEEVLHTTATKGLQFQNSRAAGSNWADTDSITRARAHRDSGGNNWSNSITWAPATIHIPEEELKQVVLMSLEDRRQMESDALMQFPDGGAFVKVKGRGAVTVKQPLVLNLSKPEEVVGFKETLHRAHSIPRAEADRIFEARRAEVLTIPPKDPFDDEYQFSPSPSWQKKRSV